MMRQMKETISHTGPPQGSVDSPTRVSWCPVCSLALLTSVQSVWAFLRPGQRSWLGSTDFSVFFLTGTQRGGSPSGQEWHALLSELALGITTHSTLVLQVMGLPA